MLSIVIPVLNEVRTLPRVLVAVSRVLPEVDKEIILVDDGSTDGTREWIQAQVPQGLRTGAHPVGGSDGTLTWADEPAASRLTVRALYHACNRGKGAGVATGLAAATGNVVVIQDADLEYDPADWAPMYDLIAHRKVADVVYGSRFEGQRNGSAKFISLSQVSANWLISRLFGILYGKRFSDIEVCYKMFTKEVNDTLNVTCPDFGCEIQISAQIVRPGRWRISELPVSYRGRGFDEGKKINWRDGVKALGYLLWFRVCAQPARSAPLPLSSRNP
ncbi:glycosyltransferase family 2 protein [Variovorax sp. IB41]|uniref:glycosyltransferase family 2 protein n=1 Tax=Variovorax sp. IB41 TaxID=2779370 RepID=UPI0018E7C9F7|nr:glycosyltransferase family 2 protein [Variovorax sp. IB41]MBJ2156783.1 glycosyltransferase family 2 protein [Variovorax sp. IB41]